ncbi:MAG: hypothetical protein ABEJ72_07820, partial [Candidatus Aenigmatarchaeota archaeon]
MREEWKSADYLTAFPSVVKVWSPFILPKHLPVGSDTEENLRICPMHNLYIAPSLDPEHNAVASSFLLEMLVRRRCSSLKSDLRLTPTEVFPYFPWPWEPEVEGDRLTVGEPSDQVEESLGNAIEDLLDL